MESPVDPLESWSRFGEDVLEIIVNSRQMEIE